MRAAKKPATAGVNTKAERDADLVMGTNNSSIVSKRSVELLYYPKPHFFRYFVKKPPRRSPLINRGYWLRMHAMAESVRRFMRQPSDKPKFVLNLGCGFTTRFVDIDYEKLMVNKKTAICRTDEITQLLENVEFLSDESPIQIRSEQYLAIGCDLKNLKKLDDVLKTEVLPSECSILFLAEVSLTYMDVKSANAVLDWASKLNNDSQFCILEQFFPDGPNHPFASTMMKHFNKLGAPLYSIHEYPSLSEQEQRFRNAGWAHAQARSLWDLWSDKEFVGSSLRAWLDTVEPFDEWEEFALFASHYFLLVASTKPHALVQESQKTPAFTKEPDVSSQYVLLARNDPRGGQRRFGALIPDSENSMGHHSGLGRQTRDVSTDLYSKRKGMTTPQLPFPPREVSARMCHTVTSLSGGDCLLVGGRASPANAFQDCWLRQGKLWQSIQSLPAPRFRHCAVKITLETGSDLVLVYGGRSSDGSIFDTWLLWQTSSNGWQEVEIQGARPPARFGACLESVNHTTGVLFGGIGSDGIIIEDFWIWKICQRSDGTIFLELTDHTEHLQQTPLGQYIHRFGSTVTRTSWGMVIAGGIVPRQIVPYECEIMLLDVGELLKCVENESSWGHRILSAIGLGAKLQGPRPLLVGHVACAIDPDQVLILGGGAVCFSFGTFWTEGSWVLRPAGSTAQNEWTLVPEATHTPRPVASPNVPQIAGCSTTSKLSSIRRIRVDTSEQFQQILANGKPVIIEGSDIGPCVELWTKEYLTDAVGSDRKVVVHESRSENMNFQAKNFSYVTKTFGDFLDEVHAGARQYLRSISAEQPTKLPANLAADFPGLKDDFKLPEALSFVTENAHSSPLRISGPVTMWLHYDVMANVLCQIRGERRLVLFPPTDVQYLQVPPGASSSTTDIFQNIKDGSVVSIPHTSPQEAVLNSGDILFIPPMWLHTASPTGGVSVAVNVFFRSLPKGYAAGRDVYGNRDLQAYEKARTDIQKMVRSFDGLPSDISRFYLLRLAQELKDSAGI
ncbi:hypothetical protein CNMCM6936_000114 [Aspergillus lentulus]|uniref:tRNA wybutosine-synthesizing protein 4 n=1 Tax=Aspergillus lentulus TaxID=293939 RepID=A0AAN5YJE4_ASPLE|nr:hypothetical protein CNMCM6069_000825 [Aspergillus lentulus]KAF4163947.1 hypothetical protein CNMCM6936_000114 [Aspergillus lentulus]KAF4180983.1 hypothetical protein CNMCM7927_000957 [Aspergillus lentulus]KAF4202475.1 hypothetical protein CNMCM8927_000161 [Aspergillus lentulus]